MPHPDPSTSVVALIERRAGLKLSGALASRLPDLLARGAARRGVSVERFAAALGAYEDELSDIIEALVVHETGFFRHAAQIEALSGTVLPACVSRAGADGRGVQVWSAGCATGEEAYTLAALLLAADAPEQSGVLATDISPRALRRAQGGRFSLESVAGMEARFGEGFDTGSRSAPTTWWCRSDCGSWWRFSV